MAGSKTFAQEKEFIKVQMNGESVDVREVAILLDGQALKSETPSFIHVDRTLVPVRFVAESYGAKVDWEQSTKTATILHEDKEIKLTIDSPIAFSQNEKTILDKNSIPRLVTFGDDDARTMVPLAFITELLGYEVGYDEAKGLPFINSKDRDKIEESQEPEEKPDESPINEKNTITGIDLDKGSTDNAKVVIKSTGKIEYESKIINSNELVIDIKKVRLDISGNGDGSKTIPVTDNNIKEIKYSQHSKDPDIVRLVITMKGNPTYDIVESEDKKSNVISFVNKIGDIKLENLDGKNVISIEGGGSSKYKLMKLSNPERIVVDLLDSSLREGTHFNHNYDLGFIKAIRGSQFNGDQNYKDVDRIVRLVLDLKEGSKESDIKIETQGDKLIIYPEKSIWEQIKFDVDGKDRRLSIKNLDKSSYTVKDYPHLKMMEISIPSHMTKLESGTGLLGDGLVGEINVIRSKSQVLVQIKYKRSIEYEVLSEDIDDNIIIGIRRNQDIKPEDRLIVIDPGHGGNDPGAVSPWGTREKDINTSISLKARDALEELGYNILMTRENDDTLKLQDRTKLANENYADLFISFHANSIGDSSIKGIQVLYCPSERGINKDTDQYPLAKSIMDELLKGTGAADKGIISRPDLAVLRTSNMPAVLIEVGFLTNLEEEKLIQTEEYQNKIVKSVIKGIENYFEIY